MIIALMDEHDMYTGGPAFQCPHCGKEYRCYWDGNDVGGKINVCHRCAKEYKQLGAWNKTPNAKYTPTRAMIKEKE